MPTDRASVWAANLEGGELRHWRAWFSDDRFAAERDARRAGLARSFPRGLHQWNLQASDDALRLWNMQMDRDMLKDLPGPFQYSWHCEEGSKDSDHKVFRAVIRKTRA